MIGAVRPAISRFMSDYGMLLALLLLCLCFSVVTLTEQHPTGESAARQLAEQIIATHGESAAILIVVGTSPADAELAKSLADQLASARLTVYPAIKGDPAAARTALEKIAKEGVPLDVIVCTEATANWAVFDNLPTLRKSSPSLAEVTIVTPRSYWWPTFLMADNLLNVANQIVVIAILAIGMTMVIVTGGIDLSVGSLIALSAVVSALLIRDVAGGTEASAAGMTLCCLAGIALCAVIGLLSGVTVAIFSIPPFIATLAMMQIASGLAYILTEGQTVYEVPESFVWLGRGNDLLGFPNAVVLMLLLYVAAHFLMTRVPLGRYIYAVGGNVEAARLSGVSVKSVLLFVYGMSGLTAGLGGVVQASQLKCGAPNFGSMYELYTIAAVVVGGTSLSGGNGKIFGTLIGAFIIAVIQNGMNLTGVGSYTQKVVLGLVILGAVLFDMLKKGGPFAPRWFRSQPREWVHLPKSGGGSSSQG